MKMTGWKTWVGGIGLILSGAGAILVSFNFETMTFGEGLNQGLAMIGAGFAALGIGHKIEKSAPK